MRSTVDPAPITYRQFLEGYDPQTPNAFNLDCVVCRLTEPVPGDNAFDAQHFALVYLTRVPNPRAAGMRAPDAFLYLRVNHAAGVEYFNRHEANFLYDLDRSVYLVRREVPPPKPPRAPRGKPPLPLPSPGRPVRRKSSIPRIVTPPPRSDDEF